MRAWVVIFAALFLGAGMAGACSSDDSAPPKEPPPSVSTGEWTDLGTKGDVRVRVVTIEVDGEPITCVLAENGVYGGANDSIDCDWNDDAGTGVS